MSGPPGNPIGDLAYLGITVSVYVYACPPWSIIGVGRVNNKFDLVPPMKML